MSIAQVLPTTEMNVAAAAYSKAILKYQLRIYTAFEMLHTVPKTYTKYDLRGRILEFDSKRLLHRTEPWTGDRYAIVMFNKSYNFSGENVCNRSNEIEKIGNAPNRFLPHNKFPSYLLDELKLTKFPVDNTSARYLDEATGKMLRKPGKKYGESLGHFIPFGYSVPRKSREYLKEMHNGIALKKGRNHSNEKFPKLYELFMRFMDEVAPHTFGLGDSDTYHICIIAKNSACVWHRDSTNIGPACIMHLGDFEGGELLVEDEPEPEPEPEPAAPEPAAPYVIVVPTFKRCKQFHRQTYTRILKEYGLCSQVVLYLQCDEDAEEYGKAFPELEIRRSPPGLPATMEYIGNDWPEGHPIVVIADDVTRVVSMDKEGKRKKVENLNTLFTDMFELMHSYKVNLAGFSPVNDPRSMIRLPEHTTDLRFIYDPLHLVLNRRVPLKLYGKMDFERTIEYYKRDGGVLRMNHYAFNSKYNQQKTPGGIGYKCPEVSKVEADEFYYLYKAYVQRRITHSDGTTSFVLRKEGAKV